MLNPFARLKGEGGGYENMRIIVHSPFAPTPRGSYGAVCSSSPSPRRTGTWWPRLWPAESRNRECWMIGRAKSWSEWTCDSKKNLLSKQQAVLCCKSELFVSDTDMNLKNFWIRTNIYSKMRNKTIKNVYILLFSVLGSTYRYLPTGAYLPWPLIHNLQYFLFSI